jgi:hypothetical protein
VLSGRFCPHLTLANEKGATPFQVGEIQMGNFKIPKKKGTFTGVKVPLATELTVKAVLGVQMAGPDKTIVTDPSDPRVVAMNEARTATSGGATGGAGGDDVSAISERVAKVDLA